MIVVIRKAYILLHDVLQLHPFLDCQVLLTVIHTLITYRLDYYNAVLEEYPEAPTGSECSGTGNYLCSQNNAYSSSGL